MSKAISHDNSPAESFQLKFDEIKSRLQSIGNTPLGPLSEKLDFLSQLSRFDFGKFLLLNQGYSAKWSHYAMYEFPRLPEPKKPQHDMELKLLNMWNLAGGRQRLDITWSILQPLVNDGVKFLSVPCGYMAELSCLDFKDTKNFKLFGVDIDPDALKGARDFALSKGLEQHLDLQTRDAWNLGFENEFDAVVSLGLNMYIDSDARAVELYREFYKALKPGGRLLVTFGAGPALPQNKDSESSADLIDQESLRVHQVIFKEIIQIKTNHRTSSSMIAGQLSKAGFSKIEPRFNKFRTNGVALAFK